MARRVVISDENLNSYGFWIKTDGIDVSQFGKNPILLWMHNRAFRGTEDEVLPIGKVTDLKFENGALSGLPVFDQTDKFAKKIESKWEAGILNMGSPGLQVIEESELAEHLKPGQTRRTVLKSKLRELSIVDLGSNDNALGLAFYDTEGKIIELADGNECPVSLLDKQTNNQKQNETEMKKIALTLGKPETATEEELNADVANLLKENKELKDKETVRELAEKTARETEAEALVDKAIKEGKINASAKESFKKLFATDFDSAKLSLESISARPNIAGQIANEGEGNVSKFEKLSWDELDKQGLLIELHAKNPTLYKQKFDDKFKK